MAKLADARDSKSREGHPSCGFDSHLRHQQVDDLLPCRTGANFSEHGGCARIRPERDPRARAFILGYGSLPGARGHSASRVNSKGCEKASSLAPRPESPSRISDMIGARLGLLSESAVRCFARAAQPMGRSSHRARWSDPRWASVIVFQQVLLLVGNRIPSRFATPRSMTGSTWTQGEGSPIFRQC